MSSYAAYGIRTRVTALRGRRPGPLDECGPNGAEGGSRTHTREPSLRPERSASAYSATSALSEKGIIL